MELINTGAGGGITCESDLEFEYEEVMQKRKSTGGNIAECMKIYGKL